VEGLSGDFNGLSPVQEGFRQQHGLQCGYCTPGMVMASTALLRENPNPNEDDIRHALEGNICRCTGYEMIVNSVRWAAENGGGK
ncbi:MAG: (2Fe-2S)-binding protein, partial [Actinobacteria bacterium]|nr:(2Fe-2S)-binding protein [Actinomycetota bacterium]